MREAFLVSLLAIVTALPGACHPAPPDPVAPDPSPAPPPPVVDGSPCEQACDRMVVLECPGAGPGCVGACERYEEMALTAPAFGWHPSCMAGAPDCGALARCRGGTQ